MARNIIRLIGVKSLQDKFTALPNKTRQAFENAMRRSQGTVERHAKGIVPVDRGFLKNSIFSPDPYWGGNTIFGEVAATMEYAYFVERTQPYLVPSLEGEARTINDIFAMELGEAQRV